MPTFTSAPRLNKILKDFVVKTRSMMGYDAPYVPGYDCHGLPIETLVEKKLAEKGKNKADIPVSTFRRICREHASTAMDNQTRDFQTARHPGRMGNAVSDDVAPSTNRRRRGCSASFSNAAMFTKACVPFTGASTIRRRWPRPRWSTKSTLRRRFT